MEKRVNTYLAIAITAICNYKCFIFGILILLFLNLLTGACIVAVYITTLIVANIFSNIN